MKTLRVSPCGSSESFPTGEEEQDNVDSSMFHESQRYGLKHQMCDKPQHGNTVTSIERVPMNAMQDCVNTDVTTMAMKNKDPPDGSNSSMAKKQKTSSTSRVLLKDFAAVQDLGNGSNVQDLDNGWNATTLADGTSLTSVLHGVLEYSHTPLSHPVVVKVVSQQHKDSDNMLQVSASVASSIPNIQLPRALTVAASKASKVRQLPLASTSGTTSRQMATPCYTSQPSSSGQQTLKPAAVVTCGSQNALPKTTGI